MQPLRFISRQLDQQETRESADRGSTLLLGSTKLHFRKPDFANKGNQESRYEFAARRSLHAGIVPNRVPNEVRWKNLLRHLRVPLPAGSSRIHFLRFICWSWRRDLNPRPPDYKSGALPTELRQRRGTSVLTDTSIPLIPARCPGQLNNLSQRANSTQPRLS